MRLWLSKKARCMAVYGKEESERLELRLRTVQRIRASLKRDQEWTDEDVADCFSEEGYALLEGNKDEEDR